MCVLFNFIFFMLLFIQLFQTRFLSLFILFYFISFFSFFFQTFETKILHKILLSKSFYILSTPLGVDVRSVYLLSSLNPTPVGFTGFLWFGLEQKKMCKPLIKPYLRNIWYLIIPSKNYNPLPLQLYLVTYFSTLHFSHACCDFSFMDAFSCWQLLSLGECLIVTYVLLWISVVQYF